MQVSPLSLSSLKDKWLHSRKLWGRFSLRHWIIYIIWPRLLQYATVRTISICALTCSNSEQIKAILSHNFGKNFYSDTLRSLFQSKALHVLILTFISILSYNVRKIPQVISSLNEYMARIPSIFHACYVFGPLFLLV